MKTKSFTSEADLIKFVENNYDVIDAYTDDKSLSSRRLHRSKASQEKNIVGFNSPVSEKEKVIALANELKNMIYEEYEKHPAMKMNWFRGKMFQPKLDWGYIDEEESLFNDVSLLFNPQSMYKYNKFPLNKWESFMPILWEYGWSWKSRKNKFKNDKYFSAVTSTVNPRGGNRMSYAYFAGTHAISDAIANFNKKHAADGIYARFMLGDTNIELFPGNRHKPYKREAIKFDL